MEIVKAVTADGQVGFDEFDQLVWMRREGEYTVGSFIHDVRGLTCHICQQPWEANGPSLGDQFYTAALDRWVHLSCHIRICAMNERIRIREALCGLVRFEGLEELPNRYWPKGDPWGAKPWYRVKLIDTDLSLVIGWRKRVISIRMEPAEGEVLHWFEQAGRAFGAESVTKEFGPKVVVVHAWGYAKLREYIEMLARVGGFLRLIGQ